VTPYQAFSFSAVIQTMTVMMQHDTHCFFRFLHFVHLLCTCSFVAAVTVMAVAIIAVVVVGPRRPRQSAALGDPPPLAIGCPRQSAAVDDLPPLAIRRCADTSSPQSISPWCTLRGSQLHRTINPRSRFPDDGGTASVAGIRLPILNNSKFRLFNT
jgi:hypothetical protein